MKTHYKAMRTEDDMFWLGIIGDKLMYSPVPFLLPYSVDQKTIETTVESSKLDTTDPSGEKIRYKLVNISLEILGE
jgi:hypothetical protein